MPSLREIQTEINNYFRHKPVDKSILDDEAILDLTVYHSLVLNSIEEFTENAYPWVYSVLEKQWPKIIEDYVALYPSKSALFYKSVEAFPEFLASEFWKTQYPEYPNYLSELASYEWLELSLYNHHDEFFDLGSSYKINSAHRMLASRFPLSALIEIFRSDDEDAIQDLRSSNVEEDAELFLFVRHNGQVRSLVITQGVADFVSELYSERDWERVCANWQTRLRDEELEALLEYLTEIGLLVSSGLTCDEDLKSQKIKKV